MENNQNNFNNTLFDSIKHIDSNGKEYWEARELQKVLEYSQWRNFEQVINKAKISCENSKYSVLYHFADVSKMVKIGVSEHFAGISKTIYMPKGAKRCIKNYFLSRYACYLIVQNGDPNKEVIALGQTYFAIQTRKQEIIENEYNILTEDEKRLYQRSLTKKGNYQLNLIASKAGVRDFDKFHNFGYRGLYGGETADDIAKRKNLRYREDILDNMGSSELIANLFRIDQTGQKLINENVKNKNDANNIHYEVGKKVRKTIKDMGGTLPENLPTPNKSLKKLNKDEIINISNK